MRWWVTITAVAAFWLAACGGSESPEEPGPCESVEGVTASEKGEEICDGLDNDCDGMIDEAVEPQSCSNTKGVCAGTTIATCDEDGYASCSAEDYGPNYLESDVEAWRCDELDNDCDGTSDEVCCSVSQTGEGLTPSVLGELSSGSGGVKTTNGVPEIAMIPADDRAPSGAVALVAHETDMPGVRVFHVDKTGTQLGSARIYDFSIDPVIGNDVDMEVLGIALASTVRGYELLTSVAGVGRDLLGGVRTISNSTVDAQGLKPDLTEDGPQIRLMDGGRIWTRLTAAVLDGVVRFGAMTYAESMSVTDPEIRVYEYSLFNRQASLQSLQLPTGIVERASASVPASVADAFADPVMRANAENGFGMVWLTRPSGSGGELNVLHWPVDDAGEVVEEPNDFQTSFQSAPSAPARVDLVWRGEETLFVAHEVDEGIETVMVEPSASSASQRRTLVQRGNHPQVVPNGSEQGDTAFDSVTAVWRQADMESGTESVRSARVAVSGGNESDVDASTLAESSTTLDRLAATSLRLPHQNGRGIAWARERGADAPEVEFVPASADGVGVCPVAE